MKRFGVVRMIVLLFFSAVHATTDPCQNYGVINQARRSSAAETDDPDLDICDIYLDPGWYRFTSYTGGVIPTSCVQPYHCSTQVPVWMNGTLPQGDDIVIRTACGNLGVPSDCCTIPFDIRVKRCTEPGGVFYVYELEPTYSCPMAYCAGNLPLCPDGEVYDDFHKHCIETRPVVPCDFERHGFCEWLQERNDDLNWAKTTGEHSSGSVLPGVDHTKETAAGSYAFIQSTASNQPGDTARFISPVIVPSETDTCNINFYYQVDGSEAGMLRIYKKGYHSNRRSLVWTSPLNRVNAWTVTTVSLVHANPFQVIIEGTLESDGQSAVSLDDVSFSPGCSSDVDGAVRLVDGAMFGEGRVEIYYDHEWGTICNRSWTQTNGDVICSQLGYTRALSRSQQYPAPASTPIHLDDVSCSSANVTKISSCSHSRWGHYHPHCDHQRDVSVACTGQWHRCRDTEFTCSNTICVPPEVRCDFTNDCGDNSDEQGCGEYPGRCDFQDGLCSWEQGASDSADWVRTDGGTVSSTEAPPTDHRTRTGGKYLLLEAASTGRTRNAVLTLSEYYLSTTEDCKIFFHYFMTTSTGQLSLRLATRRDLGNPVGMTMTSSTGRRWIREEMVVPINTTFQVSFEGQIEPSSGVIAIDDVSLTPSCVEVQVDSTKDDAKAAPRDSGLPPPTIAAIVVVCFVVPLGLIAAAFSLCYLRRKNSANELREAVHELEQRSGHDNPCIEHHYDHLHMHQTGQHSQAAQANGTAVTFQNLQRCQRANGIQKQTQMPPVGASSDEKSVPQGLTVNMDSSGYAFLQKSAMCPAYTTDTAYTDPALCRFLKHHGFSEFTDMFTDKGLTLSFLHSASEKDLISFGIPIAIAVSVLKKLHEQPSSENEYTSLNVGAASGQPAIKPITNVHV
ncbi:MAM and LDL-receptor class A domain-containing protein 1-like [Branchiostoma floridae x Branchiostoma japonicum]